ncbi:ComF family protein [Actinomadura parmotrematis]|uniref:ComF family protein n=1 Tax=Actinomadura parmotrematis TaxID=2864039 RepID=A0ABS7FY97_9ACTN|nr:phosphoribosyltransferase family protein [Actinomadura parmotrematis]MBW8484557.1 ComF family protein [Actinomadura parmotrematis]
MSFFTDLLDLLLPTTCAGCSRSPGLLCPRCTRHLARPPHRVPHLRDLPPCWTAAPYEGPPKAAITAHKERGLTALAVPLGQALAASLEAALLASPSPPVPAVVVPAPSTRAATRHRGHDPTRRLTETAVRELRCRGHPVTGLAALHHRRTVADQSGLTRAARARNLARALEAHPSVQGARVLLTDDVVTTGATLTEATRALTEAGAHVLATATVAATPLRH